MTYQRHDRVTTWKRSISYKHNQEGGEAMRNGCCSMVRKRYLLQAAVGTFFCLLATTSASEPTLQETFDFIERKTKGMWCCDFVALTDNKDEESYKGHYAITPLDDDTILIEAQSKIIHGFYRSEVNRNTGFITESSTWKMKVRLADLSTNVRIETSAGVADIVLECTKENCMEVQVINRKIHSYFPYQSPLDDSTREGEDSQKVLYSANVRPFRVCPPMLRKEYKKP